MKQHALFLLAFFAASPLSAMAESASAAPGPRPGTVEAMRCLVRQGPAECKAMFEGSARRAALPWLFQNPDRDFKRGALISSDYWGRASEANRFDAKFMLNQPAREMDIFDVKFAHVEYTFYISPADADGKIQALVIPLYAPHDPLQLGG